MQEAYKMFSGDSGGLKGVLEGFPESLKMVSEDFQAISKRFGWSFFGVFGS